MEDKDLQVKLHVLFREQLYCSAAELTSLTDSSNIFNKFYRALSSIFMRKSEEALEELSSLLNDPILGLGAILASIHIQKHLEVHSEQPITTLESLLRSERKKANDRSLYFAALFLHFNHRQEKAREYIDRALNINSGPSNIDSLILKGWIDLMSKDKSKKKNPLEFFNAALNFDNHNAEAYLGKIKYLIQSENMQEVFPVLRSAESTFPNNQEFFIEKLRAHLAAKDWDAVGSLTKTVSNTSNNPLMVKILEIQILSTVCHDGSFVDATPLLKKLFTTLEKYEAGNGDLLVNLARIFSRVCGRHLPILSECLMFVERAIKLRGKNSFYLFELAQQQILQARYKETLATLKSINQTSETSIDVMLLKIQCLLDEDQYEAAQQQLNIVEELHENAATHPAYLLAKAILMRQTNSFESIQLLKRAYEIQVKHANLIPYGVDYLNHLNPDFLLSVAEEYLQHYNAGDSSQILSELSEILTRVVDACPGLLPALYRLANANFLTSDYRAASSTLHHIIDHVDPTYIDAYLLMAEIGMNKKNIAQAAQYLEMGLSYNFQVRDHPRYELFNVFTFSLMNSLNISLLNFNFLRYHLLLAKVQRQKKETDAALSSIRMAMILSGMRQSSAGVKRSKYPFSLGEKAATYLELFHVLMDCGKKEDAGQVIEEAFHELQGTPQEGLVLLAQVLYQRNKKI